MDKIGCTKDPENTSPCEIAILIEVQPVSRPNLQLEAVLSKWKQQIKEAHQEELRQLRAEHERNLRSMRQEYQEKVRTECEELFRHLASK